MQLPVRTSYPEHSLSRLPAQVGVVVGAVAVLVAAWFLPPIYVLAGLGVAVAVGLTMRWPLAGFILLTFAVPWADGFPVTAGPFSVTLTDALVAALGTAWLASAIVAHTNPVSTRIWTPYIALFLGAIVLSATQAADWHASLKEIVKWLEMGVVYLAAAYFLRSRRDVHAVVIALVLAGVSQALLGFFQFLFGLGPEAFIAHRLFLRAYGTFDQPNPYAGYLNMVWPFAFSLGVLAGSRRARAGYRAALVLMAGAILASQSRGAMLAAAVSGAVLVGVLWPGLRRYLWTGSFLVAAGAWLATFGLVPVGPFEKVLNAVGLGNVSFGSVTNANFSAVERAAHWLAGVRMFAAHPLLGVGIGNYGVAYPAYHPRGWYASLEHAHNYYINIAAESGVAGLAAYTLLAGSALWYSCAAIRRAADRFSLAIGLGIVGALITTDFHNLFDVLYVHGMVALLGLLMALVPVIIRQRASTGIGD